MKKLMVSLSAILFAVVTMSFMLNNDEGQTAKPLDNSCTIKVTYSGGSPASGVKVSTEVGGGISCVGGRTFYTDSDGEAKIKWSDGCKCSYIYIDGTSHKGPFEDGRYYTFTK